MGKSTGAQLRQNADLESTQAKEYLLDPLNEPQPSEETGPGSSFRPDNEAPIKSPPSSLPSSSIKRLSKNNPYRKLSNASGRPMIKETSQGSFMNLQKTVSPEKATESKTGTDTYTEALPTPPLSASPRRAQFEPGPHRQEAFGHKRGTRSRGSSLGERFPGDMSGEPLESIRKDYKTAYRAPHLRKNHQIRPDTIDSLDTVGGGYHHEGPFDATLYTRNTAYRSSPVAAVAESNIEALKATPRDKIVDSVRGHRPLDGVASTPPGQMDRNGQTYNYREGENMMIEHGPDGGAYKRYPGVQYHPDDIKGKSEPSYSIEKALKKDKAENPSPRSHRKESSQGIEMTSRPKSSGTDKGYKMHSRNVSGAESNLGRSISNGGHRNSMGEGLRARIGSMKKKKVGSSDERETVREPGRF